MSANLNSVQLYLSQKGSRLDAKRPALRRMLWMLIVIALHRRCWDNVPRQDDVGDSRATSRARHACACLSCPTFGHNIVISRLSSNLRFKYDILGIRLVSQPTTVAVDLLAYSMNLRRYVSSRHDLLSNGQLENANTTEAPTQRKTDTQTRERTEKRKGWPNKDDQPAWVFTYVAGKIRCRNCPWSTRTTLKTTRVLTKGGMSLNTVLVNRYSAQKCPWYDRKGGERYFSPSNKYGKGQGEKTNGFRGKKGSEQWANFCLDVTHPPQQGVFQPSVNQKKKTENGGSEKTKWLQGEKRVLNSGQISVST